MNNKISNPNNPNNPNNTLIKMPAHISRQLKHDRKILPDEFTAYALLNSEVEPQWTKLSKPIKRALCTLVNVTIDKMHCQTFYKKLRHEWLITSTERNKTPTTAEHICITPINVECAICISTYQLDGKDKVTTLLCGHHFCTDCIFKHINVRGSQACCPMCRSAILPEPQNEGIAEGELSFIIAKRVRRRYERWTKRENERQRKARLIANGFRFQSSYP